MPLASPPLARPAAAFSRTRWPSRNAWRRAAREWARTDGQTWAFIAKALLAAALALWLAYRLELPQPSTVLVTVFIVRSRRVARCWPRVSIASLAAWPA